MATRPKRTRNQPRKSYIDAPILDIDSETPNEGSASESPPEAQEDEEDDADYTEEELSGNDAEIAVETEESAAEEHSAEDSEANSESSRPVQNKVASIRKAPESGPKKPRQSSTYPELRSNGIPKWKVLSQSKEGRVHRLVGIADDDIIPFLKARDAWMNALPLPNKRPSKYGQGLMLTPFYTETKQQKDLLHAHDWLYNGGGMATVRRLQVEEFLLERPNSCLLQKGSSKELILGGPVKSPKLFEIEPLQVVNLSKLLQSTSRTGWVLKGEPNVSLLEWVPHQNGLSQYLCISSRQPIGERDDSSENSAFKPHAPSRSSIYVWEIRAAESNGPRSLDQMVLPKLRAIISFDWSSVKQLKWCPVSTHTDLDDSDMETDSDRLGLVAAVFMDGHVRVLDICIPKSDQTQHIHISKAAFEAKPPGAICTSVTWNSATALIAGCSNGCVAIWDLSEALREGTANPKPWFYKPVFSTYIVQVCSGFPSRTHFLFVSAADGQVNFTDLRDPTADSIYSLRSRAGQTAFEWQDGTQTFLTVDDNFGVEGFYPRLSNGREGVSRMDSPVICLATSLHHPHLLAGCADGTVGCANVMRRVALSRSKVKGGHQRAIWFQYEWRRPLSQSPATVPFGSMGNGSSVSDDVVMQDFSNDEGLGEPKVSSITTDQARSMPMGRFIDGFKSSKIVLGGDGGVKEGLRNQVVYERPSAITCVCWNPNPKCGTWAAAATASGLVRIEDLAID